jgi:hypothetical protein
MLNLESSACWRESRAELFQNDSARNAKAAKMLRDFSTQLSFSDDEWSVLETMFNCADRRWIRSLTKTNRLIGFKIFPQDSADYVAYLIQNIVSYEDAAQTPSVDA